MRILIVKLSSLGDVIHTFPALTDLRSARPDIEVDWLVEEGIAGLVRAHPGVSEVHEVALRRLRWPPSRWLALIRHRRGLRTALRARRYDLVLDAQGLMKSAVLARLAAAPITGFDEASAREPAAARFYAHKLKLGDEPHVVEKLRRFFAEALGYPVPTEHGRAGLLKPSARPDIPLPPRYGIVVHSAAWPSKLWDEERWREIIALITTGGRQIVLPWGNEEERQRAGRLAAGIEGAGVLPRRLGADELIPFAAHTDFAVGLDTGLMHLAAAFDVPGVTLFGPTDPDYATPYGAGQRFVRSTHERAPCQQTRCTHGPAGTRCMDFVRLEAVRDAVSEMLAEVEARRGA